jgi:hypothetical protein
MTPPTRLPRSREGATGPVPLRVTYRELPHLAAGVAAMLARGHRVVLDVVPPGTADLAMVSELARLALTARRSAGALLVRSGDELQGLLRLTGLERPVSGQPCRQPVLDEDVLAHEVVDVRDATG